MKMSMISHKSIHQYAEIGFASPHPIPPPTNDVLVWYNVFLIQW